MLFPGITPALETGRSRLSLMRERQDEATWAIRIVGMDNTLARKAVIVTPYMANTA